MGTSASLPAFPDTVAESGPAGPISASRRTRAIYCLALAGLILGMLGQATSWVGMVFGGGVIGYLGPTAFLGISALAVYRIYRVVRYPRALDARPPDLAARVLRGLGLAIMVVGAVGASATIVRWPALLFGGGIAFFVVGIFATLAASLGWIGCLLFDAGRHLGNRVPAAHERTRRQRVQDWSVLGGLVLLAITVPWMFKQFEVRHCRGLAHCAAAIEDFLKRPVAVPWGEPVALEANIEAIEYRQTHGEDWTAVERPAHSLRKAGHPSAAAATPVKVSVQASSQDKGVVVVLTVTERDEESARFSMRFREGARLVTVDGKRRLVVELRRGVWPAIPGDRSGQGSVLDALYTQMRQAIGTPREVEVIRARRDVRATLIGKSPLDPTWQRPETMLANCEGVLKIVTGSGENDPRSGNPLSEARLVARTESPLTLLLHHNDRGTCHSGTVWLAEPSPDRSLQLRQYGLDGTLRKSLRVSLPPRDEQAELGYFDPREVRERDGAIEFAFVKERPGGGTIQRFRVTP